MIDLTGAIDIHVHAGPELFERIGDSVDMAQRARDRGMAGLVFKCHHESSVTRAKLAQRIVPGIQAWGGIALNGFVGGINPLAVAAAIDTGARVVWMPTMHARHHIARLGSGTYGIPSLTLSEGATIAEGISILDERGRLTRDACSIVGMAAERDVAVATGHLGEDEIKALVEFCAQRGALCVVTHAFFPHHRQEFLLAMADLGAIIEVSAIVAYPMARHLGSDMSLAMARDLLLALGPSRAVISSDAGQAHNPWPTDVLQSFLSSLAAVGVPEDYLRSMIKETPRRILGCDN